MSTVDPYTSAGRLTHYDQVAELANEIRTCPTALNQAATELLDTLLAWYFSFSPFEWSPGDPWFIDGERLGPSGPEGRSASRRRLAVLCDALVAVISNHEGGGDFDTEPLAKVAAVCDQFDYPYVRYDPEVEPHPALKELGDVHFDSKQLLDSFQCVHAMGCRQRAVGLAGDDLGEVDPKDAAKRSQADSSVASGDCATRDTMVVSPKNTGRDKRRGPRNLKRDRWIRDQIGAGIPNDTILKRLRLDHPEWSCPETPQALSKAMTRLDQYEESCKDNT